jgi:ATP-dependent Clp protease ATP-binding subunit ClpC
MDFILQKMSSHCKNALKSAYSLALSAGHKSVTTDHILYGLCLEKGSIAHQILSRSGIESFDVKKTILQKASPKTTVTQLGFSIDSKKMIEKAFVLANRNKHSYIGTEHLLAALLQSSESLLKSLADKKGVSLLEIQRQIDSILNSTTKFPELTSKNNNETSESENDDADLELVGQGISTANPALETFANHLTSREVQKNIDPVIGRETEINRLIQILSRRNKNNPLLLGEAGVGKTAIVEGLAKKIVQGDVPEILLNKKIYALDLGLVLAGTSFRGEFENRLKQILQEVKKNKDIILFIDEIHTIIGAGAATGSLDAANLLKPILARGEIRCIGATTPQDYKKNIEPDPALERRFQPITINQPSSEKAIAILNGLKPFYESYHQVRITPQAVVAAVELSEKYITDKFLPDKAIDLIDEASAALKIKQKVQPEEKQTRNLKNQLEQILAKKQEAVSQEKFSVALKYRVKEQELLTKLKSNKQELKNTPKKDLPIITKKEIAEIVSAAVGVPLHDLLLEERQRLLKLESLLSKRVIDQPEAVTSVAEFIRRSKTGVSNTKRPIGSFIFLGPSGVGKTELARSLAEIVFSDPRALVKIDMSEFSEGFNISKLIGAPAGYVGYREGATLTDAVKRRPYSVVLFDEIEKAHPSVFNLLLHVLEDGILTDGSGKEINFRNTIIIMTSNIGAEQFNKTSAIGFADDQNPDKLKSAFEEIKQNVLKRLSEKFPPEFLNRIDKTVVFNPLSQVTLAKIAKLQLTELKKRLANQGTNLIIHPSVVQFIALKSFAPNVGARTVRKNIQEIVESKIAQKILSQTTQASLKKITVKAKDNAIII